MPPQPAAPRRARAAEPDWIAFRARVHDALTRLHDPPGLETHPLARLAVADPRANGRRGATPGQALRRCLLDALEALRPPAAGAADGRAARAHRLLARRYLDGAPLVAVQRDLTVGRSEYFREHGRAVEAVAAVLWERWAAAGDPAGQPHRAPPARSNLPASVTTFIGREGDVAEVRRLLGGSRLVTLTGAGGVGKTRLAVRVAAELLDDYPAGVWLAELAALADAGLVPRAVLAAVGVRDAPERAGLDALVGRLQGDRTLLVLDNCEHLIEACAALADALVRRCADLRVLATSREALRIAGETVWRVPSLSAPAPHRVEAAEARLAYPAVQLFVDRARAVAPAFALTADNVAAVGAICWRLDGIPLAIELAAARVPMLPVDQIEARLDDRFRLLTVGSRTALPRHQTLRALVEWSHDLLAEPERVLLRRLAVFAGGWTLEAAEQVCGGAASSPEGARLEGAGVLDALGSLVDKSLVAVEDSGRYRLPETIRQYAEEKLVEAQEAEAARDRHAAWCAGLCEQACPALRGPDQVAWLDRLDRELDNLRAALAWSQARQPALGLRLLWSSVWFWYLRFHRPEARDWADRLLRTGAESPPLVRAGALRARAVFARGETEIAHRCARESLEICRRAGDRRSVAESLWTLACVVGLTGRHDEPRALLDEAVALARGLGDEPLLVLVLAMYGGLHLSQTQEGLEAPLEECRALAERLGDVLCGAMACRGLAFVAHARGDAAGAAALYQEDLSRCRALGDTVGVWLGLAHLGREHLALGDHEGASAALREALAVMGASRSHGHAHEVEAMEGLAWIDAGRDPARAARLLGAAEAVRTRHWERVHPPPPPDEALREALRGRLAPAAFQAAWDVGLAMSPQQAIDDALSEGPDTVPGGATNLPTTLGGTVADGPRVLSAREAEVAALLADRLTNRQIAERLVISERTADRHVSNILTKLGLHSRADVAEWLRRPSPAGAATAARP